jgi:type III secretion protein T
MLNPALIEMVSLGTLSVLLPSARIFGMMLVFPLFSWTGIAGTLRASLSLAFALPVAFAVYPQLVPVEGIGLHYVLLVMKELAVGIGLGLLLAIPFWAAKSAGDMIDVYRGASQSNIFDPLNAAESTESGTFLLLATLALFVAAGGVTLMMDVTYSSFEIWRPMQAQPVANLDALKVLLRILSEIFLKAVILAAPVMVCLAVGEIVLLFVSLGWKQFDVMSMNMVVKNLILLLLLPVYAMFLLSYLGPNWNDAHALVREVIPGLR